MTSFCGRGNRRSYGMTCWSLPRIRAPVMWKCDGKGTHSTGWCRPLLVDVCRKQESSTRWTLMKGGKGLNGITSSIIKKHLISMTLSGSFWQARELLESEEQEFFREWRQKRRQCWRGKLRWLKEPRLYERVERVRDRDSLLRNSISSSGRRTYY